MTTSSSPACDRWRSVNWRTPSIASSSPRRGRDDSRRSPATQAVAGRSLPGGRSLAREECGPVTAVPALVIAGPGTNRDRDLALALQLAGADPRIVLATELAADPKP